MTTNDISATANARVASSHQESDAEQQQREGQIYGVATESEGSRAHDRGGGAVARNGRVGTSKRANRVEEQGDGDEHRDSPEGHANGGRCEPQGPSEMQQQAQGDSAQVDDGWSHDP